MRIALKERSIKKKRVSVTDGSREAGKGEVQGRVSWWTNLFKQERGAKNLSDRAKAHNPSNNLINKKQND